MNIVSNFILHCNNFVANTVFTKFRESANQHVCRAKEWVHLGLMSLTVFAQRNFVVDFLQAKCDFTGKTAILRFSPLRWA